MPIFAYIKCHLGDWCIWECLNDSAESKKKCFTDHEWYFTFISFTIFADIKIADENMLIFYSNNNGIQINE